MKMLGAYLFILTSVSTGALADSQCGNINVHWAEDGLARINGAKPETQKITFLGKDGDYNNVKFEWIVATDIPGRWMGMEFIGRNGKAILNTQWLQASMDAPKIFSTYDCIKVE
ncbi:hypothetical protein AAHD62_25100 [Enterobacter hormaechei]